LQTEDDFVSSFSSVLGPCFSLKGELLQLRMNASDRHLATVRAVDRSLSNAT